MASAQDDSTDNGQLTRNLISSIRRGNPGFDQWSLQDLSTRLNATSVLAIIGCASQENDWYPLIPQAIRNQYGEQAPRMFMNAVYSRMESLNLVDGNLETQMRGAIAGRLRLNDTQMNALVLNRPIEVVLTNGERITVTPAEAMLHQINRAINSPDPSLQLAANTAPRPDQPFIAPYGGMLALPNSLLDGIIAANPSMRTQLESLRGKALLPVGPELAYEAGRIAQLRRTNNVTDWSLRVDDPNRICPNVPVIETDIFNKRDRDARLDEAWISGNVHNGCPGDLGTLTAPTLRRSANDNTAVPARVSATVASAGF